MADLKLDPASTDAGAMERMFLLETNDPDQHSYNRAESLKAMRWMKQVVDNRLAAPKKSRFGEPSDAATETDIISVGNQFAGFGDYPTLSGVDNAKLYKFLHIGGVTGDPRSAKYAGFVADAITAATELQPPTEARIVNLAAWRTQNSRPPGGDFKLYLTLQGNTFYTASPVPSMPIHKAKHARSK